MLLDKDVAPQQTDLETHLEADLAAIPYASHDHRTSRRYHRDIWDQLEQEDPLVASLIHREYQRQQDTLQLIAAENQCSPAVLAALGSVIQNKTTEGFVGARYHGGCEVVDQLESLAIERAKDAFNAQYANVQAHSGTGANHIVFAALLERNDRILSLGLDQGGHVSHGARPSWIGRLYPTEHYVVNRETVTIDYNAIHKQARQLRPKLIICGASAYPRAIDFKRFRAIANDVDAYLLADVSHIAGLIVAGVHASPIDAAHVTTTSTYKPGGPRGGLILIGQDAHRTINVGTRSLPLWEHLNKTTFPGVQGTPHLNNIAAKAVFLQEVQSAQYHRRQTAIVENAQVLAEQLTGYGFDVLTGGTDTHMILINVANYRTGLTGAIAQQCLEVCGIIVNMNRLPYDPLGQAVTSGIRLGTPILTRQGMGSKHMVTIAGLLKQVLDQVEPLPPKEYRLTTVFRDRIRQTVKQLCRQFPLVG